jgi:hypothetical protein
MILHCLKVQRCVTILFDGSLRDITATGSFMNPGLDPIPLAHGPRLAPEMKQFEL